MYEVSAGYAHRIRKVRAEIDNGTKIVSERWRRKANESQENVGEREEIKCNNSQQPEKQRVKDGMRARTIEPCYVNDITRAQVTTTTITR